MQQRDARLESQEKLFSPRRQLPVRGYLTLQSLLCLHADYRIVCSILQEKNYRNLGFIRFSFRS